MKADVPALLPLLAPEGVRLVALGHLEAAARAHERLGGAGDAEALHDLRVALRRLRSWLRAYKPWLEHSISGKLRRRLRDLAAATNAARDTEVEMAWLAGERPHLAPRHRGALEGLLERLEKRRSTAYDEVRVTMTTEFERLRRALGRRLASYEVEVRQGGREPPKSFAEVTAELVAGHAQALSEKMDRIAGPDDEEPAHQARIAAKRLRYLLEPLRAHTSAAKLAVERLRELQDVLGELHDCAVLADEIGKVQAEAAAERARHEHARAWRTVAGPAATEPPDARPGLLALSARVRGRRDDRFAELRAAWLDGGGERFAEPVRRVLSELRAASPQRGRRRRLLLRGLPPDASGPGAVVDEGWIVAPPITERLRRVRAAAEVRCTRSVLAELGGQAVAFEREIDPRQFRALWPLCAGRRLRMRRHEIESEAGPWELLEIAPGRVLALAPAAGGEVAPVPPSALEPLLERDVTDDPAFAPAEWARTAGLKRRRARSRRPPR